MINFNKMYSYYSSKQRDKKMRVNRYQLLPISCLKFKLYNKYEIDLDQPEEQFSF